VSGISVRSAFGKLHDFLFKDLQLKSFVTGQKVGSARRALDTIAISVYLVGTDIVEANSTNNLVNLTAHAAKEGDFLQINTTANGITEFEVSIDEIVDANSFRLGAVLSASLATGDTVSILRPIIPRMSSTGATLATITPSPLIFRLNGAEQEVIEDTGTPANNRPLPVKLVDVTGSLNITAQNLNVQSSHIGANADSMRIGDGTTELGITVSGEAKVKDTDALVTLLSLESLLTQLNGLDFSSETTLNSILTELLLKAKLTDTQPISAATLPLPSGAATQATLAAILAELLLKADLLDTQPVSAASLPLPSGASTEVTLEAARVLLNTISGKDFATQTTLALMKTALDSVLTGEGAVADAAVSNPASSGSMIALLKGVLTLITSTNTKLDTIDANSSAALNSTATNNACVTVQTFNPPASAIGMIIQNSTEAASSVRFTGSAGTPSASEGFLLGSGQSTSYMPAGVVKVISVDGGNADVCIIWFV
jgi:hypothetical protein